MDLAMDLKGGSDRHRQTLALLRCESLVLYCRTLAQEVVARVGRESLSWSMCHSQPILVQESLLVKRHLPYVYLPVQKIKVVILNPIA